MSAFILKLIAMFSMTCDHISYIIFGKFSFLNYIGRIAFPIFAFQISEGYLHTKSLKNYLIRLLVFALISQMPFQLFNSLYSSNLSLNVFFTLFFGLFAITIYDKLKNVECKNNFIHYWYILLGIISLLFLCIISNILHCDYSYYGVAIIFAFYIFKNNKLLMNLSFIVLTFIYYAKNLLFSNYFNIYLFIIIFTCFSLLFINLYNNEKGKNIKYVLYIFYPMHLLLFYLLSFII